MSNPQLYICSLKYKKTTYMAFRGTGRRGWQMTREFADGVLPYGFQMPAEGISSIWVYNRTAQIWLDFLTLISTKNQTESASCTQKSIYVFGLQALEPAQLLDVYTLSNHLSAYCELLGDTSIFCSLKVLPWIITL